MGLWLVCKKRNPKDSSDWIAEEHGYEWSREKGMIASMTPGEDFIRVECQGDADARKQATAYWKGKHQSPEEIEAWVKWARERKQGGS